MTAVDADKALLAACEQRATHAPSGQMAWLDQIRASARTTFERIGLPTVRDDSWRFTNIAPLTRTVFEPQAAPTEELADGVIQRACRGLTECHRLVFVNGHFQPSLSRLGALPSGVSLGNLDGGDERVERTLGQYAEHTQHGFTALNTACLHDIAVLTLPEGAVIELPIQLLFVSLAGTRSFASHPRVLVLADGNSRATILESFVCQDAESADAAPYFTNAVTEMVVGEKASIDYYRLQDEHSAAFHIGTTQVQLGAESKFDSHILSTGGGLARHELNVVLGGENGECNMNGFSVARRRQLIDHQTHIEHVKPHCTSRELYKAVLEDHAHGVFSGKIHVHPDAQKTDARQANHTLLLSDNAVMDTQPHLEIYADDVKCTHGASVGSMDEQATFYLRSRGIGRDDARRLLTFAFMNEVLQRIPADMVRSHLEQHLSGIVQLDGDQP